MSLIEILGYLHKENKLAFQLCSQSLLAIYILWLGLLDLNQPKNILETILKQVEIF